MSENTLLSFSIFPKFSFLRFAENVWGGAWPNLDSWNAHWPDGHTLEWGIPTSVAITVIFGKNPLFLTKFQKLFSWPIMRYWYPFKNLTTGRSWPLAWIFLFFLYSDYSTCYEIKNANNIFPRRRLFLSKFWKVCCIFEFTFWMSIKKKNMNDVRGQKMSENTLLSFSISPKFSFLRFAENVWGGAWPNLDS